MASLSTRLTQTLALQHPVVSAPMAMAPCARPWPISHARFHGHAALPPESAAMPSPIAGRGAKRRWKKISLEAPRYRQAFLDGDPDNTGVWFGEAAGLIDSIDPAADIIERMVRDAATRLAGHGGARIVMP